MPHIEQSDYRRILEYWACHRPRTGAELDAILSSCRVLFAYHSGKLENDAITYTDTLEIFEHDRVSAYTGDLRTLFEIRNERDAWEAFLAVFDEGRALDEELLLSFQKLLTRNTYDTRRWQLGERPGEYKHHDYVTGRAEVGAAPEDVRAEMAELICELPEIPAEQALTGAAYFHAKFENIHPFADGNGRTGRLAMNYLLVRLGHPFLVIHEEDRRAYYEALEAFDTQQELTPLVSFLQEQTVKTWIERVTQDGGANQRGVTLSMFL